MVKWWETFSISSNWNFKTRNTPLIILHGSIYSSERIQSSAGYTRNLCIFLNLKNMKISRGNSFFPSTYIPSSSVKPRHRDSVFIYFRFLQFYWKFHSLKAIHTWNVERATMSIVGVVVRRKLHRFMIQIHCNLFISRNDRWMFNKSCFWLDGNFALHFPQQFLQIQKRVLALRWNCFRAY
jgi:hypothetical protein